MAVVSQLSNCNFQLLIITEILADSHCESLFTRVEV